MNTPNYTDKDRIDFMEHMRNECEGHILTRCFIPSDKTLREQFDEMMAAHDWPCEN